ncbi:MAG: hypothetical protein ABSD48_18200, partial [Armatimonadota bacterium]
MRVRVRAYGRVASVLVLLIAAGVGLRLGPEAQGAAEISGPVLQSALLSLLVSPGELPRRAYLSDMTVARAGPAPTFMLHYVGQRSQKPRTKGKQPPWKLDSDFSAGISVWVSLSRETAYDALKKYANSFSVGPTEVSGQRPFAAFSDRAFTYPGMTAGRSGTVRYSRANVYVEVQTCLGPSAYDDALAICRAISRRVDAAAAGKPMKVPFMPGATGVTVAYDPDAIRSCQDLDPSVWGKGIMKIALLDRDGIARPFPAQVVGKHDYTVPLVIVGRFLGIHDAPKWDEWHGSPAAKLDGRLVTFREGSREVRIAGKPHAI